MAGLAFHGLTPASTLVVRKCFRSYSTAATSHLDCSAKTEALIWSMCERGELDRALHALSQMDLLGAIPSHNTYMSLLTACNHRKSITHVLQVHAHLVHHRLELISSLGDYLVCTLAKCGALEHAVNVVHMLPQHSVFTWTSLLSGYVECGNFHEALSIHSLMVKEGFEPNECAFVSLLKACGGLLDLEQGRKLHADVRSKGYTSNIFINSTLISMYGKCGSICEAEDVFAQLCERNVVTWNAMLSAYAANDQGEKVLLLYRQMHEEGFVPNERSFLTAIQACGILAEREDVDMTDKLSHKSRCLKIGQTLHSDASRRHISSHVFVGNTLVSMYGKCGAILEAENVFSALPQRDVVSWNAMLSACVEHDQGEKALLLYRQMRVENVRPNKLTLVLALQACGILGEKEEEMFMEREEIKGVSWMIGDALHNDAKKRGDASDFVVGSALVSMYGKCGTIIEAENVFVGLSQYDVVSWNTMLSVCVEQGDGEKALELYKCMLTERLGMDLTTIICLLQACRQTGSMETCRQLHFVFLSGVCDTDFLIETTLVNVYGSCASMVDAEAVFHMIRQPNVVAWSACIAGYARDASLETCLQSLERMHLTRVRPNHVTYLSLLYACSHAGLADKGADYFECMNTDVGVAFDFKHYACMVGILGRAGNFSKVENILGTMPMHADWTFWMGLLGACRIHGNVELGKHAFDVAVRLQPKEAAAYLLMASIYEDAGLPDLMEVIEKSRPETCEQP